MFSIESSTFALPPDARFSILIPTWNNLPFLKLCMDSINQNSRWRHQVILHINDGSDGTYDWAMEQEIDHTYSPENIGICYGLNAAAELAKTDYLMFLNDDMYVCPAWDHYLDEAVKEAPGERFYLSGTLIEPRDTGNACTIVTDRFGDDLETLDKNKLLHEYDTLPFQDWSGATWPPSLMHKNMWELVGGMSVEFSPGMYSDPDLSMKLWQAGVRWFQGVSKSRVFHFMAKSTGRVTRNDGRTQFMRKWGISSNAFMNHYLKIGQPFQGILPEPQENWALKWSRFKSRLA